MGGECSTHGGDERRMQGFGGKTCGKERHLGDPVVDGTVTLSWIFIKWNVGAWTGSGWLRKGTGGGLL